MLCGKTLPDKRKEHGVMGEKKQKKYSARAGQWQFTIAESNAVITKEFS